MQLLYNYLIFTFIRFIFCLLSDFEVRDLFQENQKVNLQTKILKNVDTEQDNSHVSLLEAPILMNDAKTLCKKVILQILIKYLVI